MDKITVHINGDKHELTYSKLTELFQKYQMNTTHVAVAVNNAVIPSAELENTILKDGDHIEIVRPVCGG